MSTTESYTGKFRGCNVIVSKDAGLWHMSISRTDRLPTYDELKDARYHFLSDVKYIVQIFPPKSDFVNVHQFCLHLWEPKEPFMYSELESL